MFCGSPEHLTFLRYEVLSPQRRYSIIQNFKNTVWIYIKDWKYVTLFKIRYLYLRISMKNGIEKVGCEYTSLALWYCIMDTEWVKR